MSRQTYYVIVNVVKEQEKNKQKGFYSGKAKNMY